MNIILLVIAAIYLIMTAYEGYAAIEKLKKAVLGEADKIHRYRVSIAWNCISGLFVFAVIGFTAISAVDIGFRNIAINFDGFLSRLWQLGPVRRLYSEVSCCFC